MTSHLDELMDEVRRVAPQLADTDEVAALIESFGWNDGRARKWGFPDVFALAEHIFLEIGDNVVPERKSVRNNVRSVLATEVGCALRKLSCGFAFSASWMVLLLLEYLRPDLLQVKPELGGALALSLIASLITAGGFVQVISRSGNFYFGLHEPFLAHRFCALTINLGWVSSLACALVGVSVGLYFHAFAPTYLALGAINYVALCLLWMFCAVLTVQGNSWCIPCIFLVSALAVASLQLLFHPGATVLLIVSPLVASLGAMGCGLVGFQRQEKRYPDGRLSAHPRLGVAVLSLLPLFAYGTVYFSFLFADRLVAGTAIPWTSGLSFGINAAYKTGMDLVLAAFLVTAAAVEYLSDHFLRLWFRLATELPNTDREQLAKQLRERHYWCALITFSVFAGITFLSGLIFGRLSGMAVSLELVQTAVLGGIGYLALSIALLELIILASVNATSAALRSISLGLGVNLLVGYVLSHSFGVQYAAVGLLAGSIVILWKSHGVIRRILRDPDYYYAIA